MKRWLSRVFRETPAVQDNAADYLLGDLLSGAEERRNQAAESILERIVRLRAPFRLSDEAIMVDPDKSRFRRLWDYIQSVETLYVDFDRPGNRSLLRQLVKAVDAKEVSPERWQVDSRRRWQAVIDVLGDKQLSKIRHSSPPAP